MEEKKSFAELLAEAQEEMPNPKKSREGQKGYQHYKYAPLDSVVDIVKKPLNKRGIFFTQPCERLADGTMQLSTVVMYEDQRLVLDTQPYEYDSDPQDFGKRETYARRYSLLTAFGLAGEDDTDGDVGAKPKNPTSHPLGNTTGKPPAKKPDAAATRKKRLAAIAELKMKCIENGVKEEGLNSYAEAAYGTSDAQSLTDDQIVEYGKYLRQMETDSAHDLKGDKQ